jgi:hypothetical protein
MLGDILDNVPVLLDQPILHAIKVGDGAARFRRVADGMGMDDDKIIDSEDVFDVDVHVGRSGAKDLRQFPDALRAVG